MLLFALQLGWLPPSGRPTSAFSAEGFPYIVMPAITLGLGSAGLIMRLTRSQLLEVLGEDYVRTAQKSKTASDAQKSKTASNAQKSKTASNAQKSKTASLAQTSCDAPKTSRIWQLPHRH